MVLEEETGVLEKTAKFTMAKSTMEMEIESCSGSREIEGRLSLSPRTATMGRKITIASKRIIKYSGIVMAVPASVSRAQVG